MIVCSAAAPSGFDNHFAYAGPVEHVPTAPIILPEYHQAVAKVGEFVEHVPSSVSHHSSSVVHSSAAVATPVVTSVEHVATPIVEEVREAQFHAAQVLTEVQASSQDTIELRPEVHHASAFAKVGEFVEHVPSSVSHHSSSVVHSSAAVATPVITPIAKTIVSVAPVFKVTAVHEASPVFKEVEASGQDTIEVRPEIHHASASSFEKIGEVVKHVPTSESHYSSSVVHSSAAIATPVITPVAKTIVEAAPIYKAAPLWQTVHVPTYAVHYQEPLYYSAPYASHHHGLAYHSQPLLHSW